MPTVTAKLNRVLAQDPTAWASPMIIASKSYRVEFTWDNRASNNAGAWRVTWQKSDGTILFAGKKLVLTDDFFEPFHYFTDIPEGRLNVRRADNGTADPGLDDLGGAVLLEYITEDV